MGSYLTLLAVDAQFIFLCWALVSDGQETQIVHCIGLRNHKHYLVQAQFNSDGGSLTNIIRDPHSTKFIVFAIKGIS